MSKWRELFEEEDQVALSETVPDSDIYNRRFISWLQGKLDETTEKSTFLERQKGLGDFHIKQHQNVIDVFVKLNKDLTNIISGTYEKGET